MDHPVLSIMNHSPLSNCTSCEVSNRPIPSHGQHGHNSLGSIPETLYGRPPFILMKQIKLTISPAVSSTVLSQLDLYAQWSAAANCSGNTDGANTVDSCSAGNCPDMQAANTKMPYEFDKYVTLKLHQLSHPRPADTYVPAQTPIVTPRASWLPTTQTSRSGYLSAVAAREFR